MSPFRSPKAMANIYTHHISCVINVLEIVYWQPSFA